jgi:glycosyltransferase involved in cell wall biosynthesis
VSSITALVPTFNCEGTIQQCLESLRWVDRIFVVDSFSTDGTLEICRRYTDWIVQHEYVNSAAQKNWAMDQIQTEWTLQLDSDERVESALRDEIIGNIEKQPLPDGFRIRIKNHVWGVWTKSCGLYPCAQVRLFRTAKGRWSRREVHARLVGLEHILDLQGHILHEDLADISNELQQFSRQVIVWEANELVGKGKKWHWWDVTLRPLAIFVIYYFERGGFREGFRGFYLSVYRSFYSFMTYARLYEWEVYNKIRR